MRRNLAVLVAVGAVTAVIVRAYSGEFSSGSRSTPGSLHLEPVVVDRIAPVHHPRNLVIHRCASFCAALLAGAVVARESLREKGCGVSVWHVFAGV